MVSAEEFFLRYAFPCANVLLDAGTIDKESYSKLEKGAMGEALSRDFIEKSFSAAFRRIKNLADRMGVEDYWDRDVIEEYWYRDHNRVIDERDGNYVKFPEVFCDFCKVHVAKVLEVLPEGFLLVGYEDKRRPVLGKYVSGVGVGERVRIHHAYAVERFID